MITVEELKAAIAECEGERNPNANTCMKLSAYYILLREKQGHDILERPAYSYASAPSETPEVKVGYLSDTDFSKAIQGKPDAPVWAIMDELMTVLQAIKPNLYDGVMRKIKEI